MRHDGVRFLTLPGRASSLSARSRTWMAVVRHQIPTDFGDEPVNSASRGQPLRSRCARPLTSHSIAALLFLAGTLSVSGVAVRPVAAQAGSCDPSLRQSATDPHGYRMRGDRCEGIYAQPVAGTSLIVASFTGSFETYDTESARNLVLRWTAPGLGDVRLRALALPRRLYYRMDATQSAAAGSWSWPSDVLAELGIERADLGVAAWTRQVMGSTEHDVYLPLRIDTGQVADTLTEFTLVVVPQVELTEVYVSIATVGGDGLPTSYIRDEEPLGYGYYPADRPMDIAIARPAEPGIYHVLIGGVVRSGGSLATELLFYVPPG